MGKGNLFLSQGRGKVGSVVFSVIKGQQIERVYNPQPANPRSYAQQAQRALLANMTKFYKRGTQNFYKFAFEDKTARESDYNAFARNNMQKGVYFTKELYDNPACPALGDYQLTRGSISHSIKLSVVGDNICIKHDFTSLITTLGQLSAWILSTENTIQQGDIFTMVIAESDLQPGNTLYGSTPPGWNYIQFIIDPSSTETLASVGLYCLADSAGLGTYRVYASMNAVDRASFASLTISRNTATGLKVSNTEMTLSSPAMVLIDWNRGDYAKRQAAVSWGGNPDAFLQGGRLNSLPDLTGITVGAINNTPYAYGTGRFRASGQDLTIAATLAGSGLKTTAQGGRYRFVLYDATLYDIEESSPTSVQPRIEVSLEATGTATAISLSGTTVTENSLASSSFQGFGLLYVDDIPVWWGFMQYGEG